MSRATAVVPRNPVGPLGPAHIEGERVAGCSDPARARRPHPIRDTVVRVTGPAGGGAGRGDRRPTVTGGDAGLGPTAEASFP